VNVGVVSGGFGLGESLVAATLSTAALLLGTAGATGEVVIAGGELIPNGNIYVGEHVWGVWLRAMDFSSGRAGSRSKHWRTCTWQIAAVAIT